MTDERAKRFPLALADLVREPRKATARPDASGKPGGKLPGKPALKAVPGGGVRKPVPAATLKSGSSAAKPVGGKVSKLTAVLQPGSKTTTAPKLKSAVPAGNTATAARGAVAGSVASAAGEHRLPAKPHAASKPSTVVAHHQPGALRSGARTSETRDVRDFATHAKAQDKRDVSSASPPEIKPSAIRKSALQTAVQSTHALTSERVRERMVERLRANGITDSRVLAAMSVVPRHMFVDPGLAAQAYEDAALPIGHHQTISKPSVVARMIELVAAGRTLKNVLEIGTGCGYQAAVLSQVATDVYSIERIRPLSERAKLNLRPLRVPNIRLHYGDGRLGLPAAAPFDAIVIACAGLDVPQALLDQLAVGGRLVAPVGSQTAQAQILTLVERVSPTQWRESQLDRVFFVPLKSGVI
jgi:protein-L-isoaspartate(D-aspartate) O-methyltransferase